MSTNFSTQNSRLSGTKNIKNIRQRIAYTAQQKDAVSGINLTISFWTPVGVLRVAENMGNAADVRQKSAALAMENGIQERIARRTKTLRDWWK
jgi:hypothetical protein